MNERFKELYSQASEYAIAQCGHANIHAGRTLAEVANEKFAELIVRECVNKIEEKFTRHSATRSVRNTDYNVGLATAVEAIEEHFGVENE